MSKVRIYDLAKELKLDNKKVIEEVRRFGYDVSVPSNSVPLDIAEKVKSKYFPQKTQAVRQVKLVKHRGEDLPGEAGAVYPAPQPISQASAAQPQVAKSSPPVPAPDRPKPEEAKPAASPISPIKIIRKVERSEPTVTTSPVPAPAPHPTPAPVPAP